jgi:hypothetical protein
MFGHVMGLHRHPRQVAFFNQKSFQHNSQLSSFRWQPYMTTLLSALKGFPATMTRSRYYHSLTTILLIFLWVALETTEASPLSRTTTQLRKRGRRSQSIMLWEQAKNYLAINEYGLDRIDNPIVTHVLPAPTIDEKPTKKREVVVSDPTSTITVGGGGVVIDNGGGTTGSKGTESGGLTTANKITIGLAIPGAIAGIVTLILAWQKCKHRRQKKARANGAMEVVSVWTEPKPQIAGHGQSEVVQGSRWARRY